MAKIVVVDEQFATGFPHLPVGWPGPAHQVVIPDAWAPHDLADHLRDADAIIAIHRAVDGTILDLAPELKVIGRPGAGVDNVDIDAATARGIVVTNVTGTRSRSVAEHGWFLILHLVRRGWLRAAPDDWTSVEADQLGGRTLGVVGFGSIGQQVARIGHGFGMNVCSYTRNPDPALAPDLPVEFCALDSCLSRSFIVVLCVPHTAATRHLIDAERLRRMPRGSIVINVARGAVVVTKDLANAVERGHLGGAGLDVTDPEPLPPDHRLYRLPNVLISPHIAGRSDVAQRESVELLGRNLVSLLSGSDTTGIPVVNPQALATRSR